MRLAVVGSHDFHDYSRLKHTLDNMENISMLLSGGAKGADSLAEIYAREKNIELKRLVPDWSTYGRAAGMIRNKDIVAEAEQVVAFWDGKSKGTKHSIELAKKIGVPVLVVNVK
jgi:hypothetical protein